MMPRPHGGRLVDRVAKGGRAQSLAEEAAQMPRVEVPPEFRTEVESIAWGLYSPLEGPMGREALESVVERGRLPGGLPWTIPIVLDVSEEEAEGFQEGDTVALVCRGEPFAVLEAEEKYACDKARLCRGVYGTEDLEHPGVAKTMALKPVLVGGRIELFKATEGRFPQYRLKPEETRFLFKEKGWRTVAGFQTRNAPHIGHEYVQKTALSFVDGLFINPLIGKKKPGDFRDEVILKSYEALIANYFLKDSAVLVTLEMEMRYAGPKEAIHHAIVRKNYGCSHFIVGRDHAGVGNYYGPFDAQEIFEDYPDLGITPIFFRNFFHCNKCGGPQNDKICPHGEEDRIYYRGRDIRRLLREGKRPDARVMRPEVVDIILGFEDPFVG